MLHVQQKNGSIAPIRKPSYAYGSESLSDLYPIDQPDLAVWQEIRRPEQHLRRIWSAYYPFCNTSSADPESCKALESLWTVKNNSFTRKDAVGKGEEQLSGLILRLMTYLPESYRGSLTKSLLALFRDALEEDPHSAGITIGSLRQFMNFLQSNIKLKCPTISLTPEYNIYSAWREAKGRLFSVHFLPSGDVRFVIFKPNERHPERKIRISGTATTDVLMETVMPYGVLDWISE